MRHRLMILGFVSVPALALVVGACGGTGSTQQCPDEELVCVRGGSWEPVCKKFVYGDAEIVPIECCTWGRDASSPRPDAGKSANLDGGLPFPDAGSPFPPGKDAGRPGRDAGKSKYPPLGDCGDGGWPYSVDAGWFYSLFRDGGVVPAPGPDDEGGMHVYQCYIDVCNPPHWSWDGGIMYDGGGLWWLFPSDASVANCGPLGCP